MPWRRGLVELRAVMQCRKVRKVGRFLKSRILCKATFDFLTPVILKFLKTTFDKFSKKKIIYFQKFFY
jgi:hypothetical protein